MSIKGSPLLVRSRRVCGTHRPDAAGVSRWHHPARRSARIVLDDEMLLDIRVDVCAGRGAEDAAGHGIGIQAEPGRDSPVLQHLLEPREVCILATARMHTDDLPDLRLVRRDVYLAPIDRDVPVGDELARLRSRVGEAETEDYVVQPHLEDAQEILTGRSRAPLSLLEVPTELAFEDAVDEARLLLLPELEAVFGHLAAALGVLARWIRLAAGINRTLGGETALSLEEELDPLAPADLANRTGIACHRDLLDPPTLGRPAPIVRDRGDIGDRVDQQPCRLKRPDRRLAAGARSLDIDIDLTHAVIHRLASRILRRDACRVGSALARALEAARARAAPGDHGAGGIGDRDDR